MSPYITYRDTDKSGVLQYFILQRKFPHYQAVILDRPKDGAIVCMPIPGYQLYVTFAGTIQGNYVLSKADLQQELQTVFEQMTDWYYKERILTDQKKYKKFKI
jgi:hypothetical protein